MESFDEWFRRQEAETRSFFRMFAVARRFGLSWCSVRSSERSVEESVTVFRVELRLDSQEGGEEHSMQTSKRAVSSNI